MSCPAAAHCGGKGVCGSDDAVGLLEMRRLLPPPTVSPAGPKCSSASSEIELAESRESFRRSSSSSASFCFRFSPVISQWRQLCFLSFSPFPFHILAKASLVYSARHSSTFSLFPGVGVLLLTVGT